MNMRISRFLIGVVVLLAATAAGVVVARTLIEGTDARPKVGALDPDEPRGGCPESDNCVSSYALDERWAIAPLACEASTEVRREVIDDAVLTIDETAEVVAPGEQYVVHTPVLRFPDDMLLASSSRGIEVLSGSRLGRSDVGANRERVEQLRALVAADPRCG